MNNEFGRMLKLWRNRLQLSQQQLSGLSGISTKHLSFLETGRSRPTRNMVDKLAETLALPLEERQLLIEYAGLQSSEARDGIADDVRQTLQMMLDAHDPYPGVVSNYILQPQLFNAAALRFLEWFEIDLAAFQSGMDIVLSDKGILQYMEDWEETVAVSVRLLHAKAQALSDDHMFQQQLTQMLSNPDLKAIWDAHAGYHGSVLPSVPIKICKDGRRLQFQMVISTFGTPRGLGLQESEHQLDFFYPADQATDAWLRALSK